MFRFGTLPAGLGTPPSARNRHAITMFRFGTSPRNSRIHTMSTRRRQLVARERKSESRRHAGHHQSSRESTYSQDYHGVDARPALGKQALAPTSRSSSLSRRSAIITRIILAMHVTGAAASRDEVTSCQRPTAEWLAIDQVCCASAAPCAPLTRLRKANAPLTRDVCFCRVRRPTERVTGKPSPRSAPKFS